MDGSPSPFVRVHGCGWEGREGGREEGEREDTLARDGGWVGGRGEGEIEGGTEGWEGGRGKCREGLGKE